MYMGAGIVGAIGGYFYYKFVGCRSGICPMTSHPVSSSIFGGLFGVMMLRHFLQ